jgi:hypothetical protein
MTNESFFPPEHLAISIATNNQVFEKKKSHRGCSCKPIETIGATRFPWFSRFQVI